TQIEHIESASPLNPDIDRTPREVREAPGPDIGQTKTPAHLPGLCACAKGAITPPLSSPSFRRASRAGRRLVLGNLEPWDRGRGGGGIWQTALEIVTIRVDHATAIHKPSRTGK